jgi:Tetratricopeptide repeat
MDDQGTGSTGQHDPARDRLAAVRKAVTANRQLAASRRHTHSPELATSLNTLSVELAAAGRREEALAAIEESVAAYRQLASAQPETFTRDLAVAFNNLSNRLASAGRRDDAHYAAAEAAALWRHS